MSLHIVCPHCHITNRVPKNRLSASPQCGACHEPLFTAHPVELTSNTFNQHISHSHIPVLADFWAPWCGPCKVMIPAFAKAAAVLEPQVRLIKINTENEQTLATRFNIRSIPTLILFNAGQEIARQAGAMSKEDIVRWAQEQS
ncbi:thioredoxin [Nitrosomonas cryotolerans]|uniref:Thioredoxin n=1 Tax=Nitrosomonas cryotolerans ATCC 49181 TaxID=1131553 RepID=A0A1N6FRJ6_9PROT|nr:thioredoxin TrxC [Nitrosomonas cryotolerans]SFP94175.1 thioredoxin [Nitrosomonas cryotolerans]SIN97863.1 thioredoxin [Nitrosomonas cryotolerans ATCC 49181]